MTSSPKKGLSFKENVLRHNLFIIESLVFVLPICVLYYIFYRNNFHVESSQMVIFAFTLALILVGLIILRQIFDRFSTLAISIKLAKDGDTHLIDMKKIQPDFVRWRFLLIILLNNFADMTQWVTTQGISTLCRQGTHRNRQQNGTYWRYTGYPYGKGHGCISSTGRIGVYGWIRKKALSGYSIKGIERWTSKRTLTNISMNPWHSLSYLTRGPSLFKTLQPIQGQKSQTTLNTDHHHF